MPSLPYDYVPEFESLKDLLLEMPRERSLGRLLRLIVKRFAERPHLALARIWLVRRGDRCDDCREAGRCTDRTRCLHLVASAGRPLQGEAEQWSRLEGSHARIPLGEGKIGRVAATGEGISETDFDHADRKVFDLAWVRSESIETFASVPLVHQGEVLGVLAIFLRISFPGTPESRRWLRLVADHAAIAISNARAFAEIERLRRQIESENAYLRREVREVQAYHEILGDSAPLQNLRRQIELVAPTDASVLIGGESGTGKELAAREIHWRSRRADRPLIKVNCAAIPRTLYESEFFGHVKGAFTGAVKDRPGRFELANGGTLLLDEVGEIPLELQSQLLRVVQEGQFERVGDDETRQVDVRIIASSNRDLGAEVQAGRFREDLYYRLNVFPVYIAPLRERVEDIEVLAVHFLALAARRLGREPPTLGPALLKSLQAYHWPGNVRELQNVIERAVIVSADDGLLHFDLSAGASSSSSSSFSGVRAGAKTTAADTLTEVIPQPEWRRLERENLRAAVLRTGGKIYGPGGAAELLAMKPTTLASRLRALYLTRDGLDIDQAVDQAGDPEL